MEEPVPPSRYEIVFEIVPTRGLIYPALEEPSRSRHERDDAAASLRQMWGVIDAHVDPHRTWALVEFDPARTTVAALTGSLAAHGLHIQRMRWLAGRRT